MYSDRQGWEPKKIDTRHNGGVQDALGRDTRDGLVPEDGVEESSDGPSSDRGDHADLDTTSVKLCLVGQCMWQRQLDEVELNWDKPWNI